MPRRGAPWLGISPGVQPPVLDGRRMDHGATHILTKRPFEPRSRARRPRFRAVGDLRDISPPPSGGGATRRSSGAKRGSARRPSPATLGSTPRPPGSLSLTGHCYDLSATPPHGPWLDLAARYRPGDDLPPLPRALASERIEQIESQAALFAAVRRFLGIALRRSPGAARPRRSALGRSSQPRPAALYWRQVGRLAAPGRRHLSGRRADAPASLLSPASALLSARAAAPGSISAASILMPCARLIAGRYVARGGPTRTGSLTTSIATRMAIRSSRSNCSTHWRGRASPGKFTGARSRSLRSTTSSCRRICAR